MLQLALRVRADAGTDGFIGSVRQGTVALAISSAGVRERFPDPPILWPCCLDPPGPVTGDRVGLLRRFPARRRCLAALRVVPREQATVPDQDGGAIPLPSRDTLASDHPFGPGHHLIPDQTIAIVVALKEADDLLHARHPSPITRVGRGSGDRPPPARPFRAGSRDADPLLYQHARGNLPAAPGPVP